MPRYIISCTETRAVEITVEADSEKEAVEKVECGDYKAYDVEEFDVDDLTPNFVRTEDEEHFRSI